MKARADLADYPEAYVKSRAITTAVEEKAGTLKAAREWEVKYHGELTAEKAAELVGLAVLAEKAKPKEYTPAVRRLKDVLRSALAKDVESAKVLLERKDEPEEVGKARGVAAELIEKAKK